MASTNGKLTIVSNYEPLEFPLLHFLEAPVKEYSQQRVNELRNMQMVTRRYPELFVQHFCAILEETTVSMRKEVTLSVIRQAYVGDDESILKIAQDKTKLGGEINRLKELAINHLKHEGILCKPDNIFVCLIERSEKPELRVSFRQYIFEHHEIAEEQVDCLPEQLPRIIVNDPGVVEYFSEQLSELDGESISLTDKLLKVEQTYFSKVFAETDQLTKLKQFEGEEKWLNTVPKLVLFRQMVNGKEYPTVPYFSNAGCVSHFYGWSMEGKSAVEKDIQSGKGRRCEICKQKLGNFVQDAIMNRIMGSLYNPRRSPIYYYPAINRFKLFDQKTGQIGYENYYHFRDTHLLLGLGIPRAPSFGGPREEFSLTFMLKDKKRLISDPCRGRQCRHLACCDMRDLYRTKKQLKYKCPICKSEIMDGQILYLKEMMPLIKLAQQTMKKKKGELTGIHSYFRVEVIHGPQLKDQNVKLKHRLKFGDEEEVVEVPRIYKSLQDPLYPYDETELNLSDEELQNEVQNYYWPKEIEIDS